MILTEEILEQGKSCRGGWCLNQFRALGIALNADGVGPFGPVKGWKKTVVGKDFSESDIQQFLSNRQEKKPRKVRAPLIQNIVVRQVSKKIKPKIVKPERQARKSAYAMSDDFLQSYEWRKVRMQALTKYGARCQCCGASPATGAVMNVDHIKPRRIYPELALNLDNLQVLCNECNHGKGNWDMTDWRPSAQKLT